MRGLFVAPPLHWPSTGDRSNDRFGLGKGRMQRRLNDDFPPGSAILHLRGLSEGHLGLTSVEGSLLR